MTSWNDAETPVVDSSRCNRHPDCQHVRIVGLRTNHSLILMPAGAPYQKILLKFSFDSILWRFDPHVLDRIGQDLGADKRFGHVEQFWITDQRKYVFAQVDGV